MDSPSPDFMPGKQKSKLIIIIQSFSYKKKSFYYVKIPFIFRIMKVRFLTKRTSNLIILVLYFRYFHGDLILNSYDGYGTDAVVYLKTQTQEATELLPIFNKTSTRQYKSAVPTADWTDPSFCVNRGIYAKAGGGGGGAGGGTTSTSG